MVKIWLSLGNLRKGRGRGKAFIEEVSLITQITTWNLMVMMLKPWDSDTICFVNQTCTYHKLLFSAIIQNPVENPISIRLAYKYTLSFKHSIENQQHTLNKPSFSRLNHIAFLV